MPDPVTLPRADHALSRRDVDPDALKVLYRLHHAGYVAYLVGGSVRDLLLGRRPKDFDVGTSAHPYQIKRLFRNSWIIGRRFRLAHVKFGTKVIEVATFRKQVPSDAALPPIPDHFPPDTGEPVDEAAALARQIHRDNTFGTPEEDAFRRDFTVNALFYDIATFSVIDYVGGIEDLRAGLIRCIGDPSVRFIEDPVRMMRAIVLAARLDFRIDAHVLEAIVHHKALIATASPARLIEECYKVLRSGASLRAFHLLGEVGLLQQMTPEIPWPLPHPIERSLSALDEYRARFTVVPDTFTNPVLLGSLIAPAGLLRRRRRRDPADEDDRPRATTTLGALPVARRDLESLDHAMALLPRLADPVNLTPRAQRSLINRLAFKNALTWLEIHGDAPETVERWRELSAESQRPLPEGLVGTEPAEPMRRRRRRRRRRPLPDLEPT